MSAEVQLMTVAQVLLPLFKDDDVYEIGIKNAPTTKKDGAGSRVFGVRGSKGPFEADVRMPSEQRDLFLIYAARCAGVDFGDGDVLLSCALPSAEPLRGARLQAVLPPIAQGGPQISIRKRPREIKDFDQYVADRTLSRSAADYLLDVLVKKTTNLLVVGSVDSGKTTLLNALYQRVGKMDPLRAIAILERGASEIWLPNKNSTIDVAKAWRDGHVQREMLLDELVGPVLRMGPKSIVLGEIRETMDADAAINSGRTGHRGGAATLHAGSALEGLQRLKMIAAPGQYGPDVAESLAAVFGSVVFIKRCPTEESYSTFRARAYELEWRDGFELEEIL